MVDFALQMEPLWGFQYEEIRDLALLCEDAGFHSLWCSDHLFYDDQSEDRNCWEAWTALAGLARETTTLRLGTLVTCNSYRYPSVLAKIAACVDAMSGGRLEFGFGAGWKEDEYEAYGIPFPPVGERVDRFQEAVQVIKAMWTQPKATFEGRYHQVKDAFCAPKPVQKPHPPLWIGCEMPRMIALAAAHADGVNFTSTPSADVYRQRLDHLHAACEKIGRDVSTIRQSHFAWVIMADRDEDLDRIVRDSAREANMSVERYTADFHFVGTADDAVDYFRGFANLGVELFNVLVPYRREAASVRLITDRVAPKM